MHTHTQSDGDRERKKTQERNEEKGKREARVSDRKTNRQKNFYNKKKGRLWVEEREKW
jgi:hypothetical protein